MVAKIPLATVKGVPFVEGRPFLHCRLECDNVKPRIFTDAMFLLSKQEPKSFITSRIFSDRSTYPNTISNVFLRIFLPFQEYEIEFESLAVVPYIEKPYGESLPHTLGNDFLSICTLVQGDQGWLLEMPNLKVKIS